MRYIPICQQGVVQLILFGIEAASPSIAAIITVIQSNGRHGVKDFLRSKCITCFRVRFCIIGLLTPSIILTLAKLITYLTPYHNTFAIPSVRKIIVLCWALVAEELGWRGFLQGKLEHLWGSKITPLLVGLIWAVWHYHFMLSGSLCVPLLPFTVGCIAESYGYYVLTKLAKGNVIPAALWHFSGNVFITVYLLDPSWNAGNIIPYTIMSLVNIVYIFAFIYYRKGMLKGSHSCTEQF
jgi:membrane protease YdiL (CAAX protease family)